MTVEMLSKTSTRNQPHQVEGFQNRDRKSIIGLILSIIKNNPNIKRTKLQWQSYLSSKQMRYFSDTLSKNDLIKIKVEDHPRWGTQHSFTITDKGDKYIKLNRELEKLLGD